MKLLFQNSNALEVSLTLMYNIYRKTIFNWLLSQHVKFVNQKANKIEN